MATGRLIRSIVSGCFALALMAIGSATAHAQSSDQSQTSPPGQSGAECMGDGDVEFICGPVNPEDLAKVPGAPWVIVATYKNDGYLSAAHTGDGTTVEIYPGEEPQVRQDTELYGDCPGAMPEDFWAHGISLRPGDDQVHTLFVVRHGGREAIEVFEVDASGETPSLTWIGCVLQPPGGPPAPANDLNSVIWLPDGGLAVTRFAVVDEVWEWHRGDGWSAVPGTKGIGANGIEVSPDGRYYYVGGWATEALYRVSREAPYQLDELWVGFHIDNVHFDDSGRLLVAGHDATPKAVLECALNPDGSAATDNSLCTNILSKVLRVDQDLQNDEEIFRYRTNEYLALATAAIQVGDEIWIGGLAGERIAVIDAPC